MIEIIQEESWDSTQEKKELPKNIRQIGTPDIGDRIYIENQPYQRMHPYGNVAEKAAYVMLGRFENFGGKQCTFIEAVIELEEIEFEGNLPVWNDDTWAYLYRKLKHVYDDMVIVGWALDIRGHLPNMTAPLEKLHRSYFGGAHQLLFLMDTLEQEEAFYGLKNGYLARREGYYIYFDKLTQEQVTESGREAQKVQKEEPMLQERATEQEKQREEAWNVQDWNAQERGGVYRDYLRRQETSKSLLPSYTSTFLLIAVVCALCFSAYQNYQKMDAMEQALTQMNTAQSDVVKVEQVSGSVTKEAEAAATMQAQETEQPKAQVTEQQSSEIQQTESQMTGEQQTGEQSVENQQNAVTESASESPAATSGEEPQATETMTEAQTYLAQGYYIVQQGDSLVGICQKIYQTTAMMDKLCETNGIDNPDAIYAGQYLTLPN